MLAQDFEGSFDLCGRGATADVEEIRWLSTLELNDVHSGHGKAGSIDHATNVAIEGDVIQADCRRFGLINISVCASITLLVLLNDALLSEKCVLVDIDLCINTVDIQVRCHGPRVDFDLSRIHFDEHVVQFLELLDALSASFTGKIEVVNDLFCKALRELIFDRETDSADGRGILFGNRLDIHTTLL